MSYPLVHPSVVTIFPPPVQKPVGVTRKAKYSVLEHKDRLNCWQNKTNTESKVLKVKAKMGIHFSELAFLRSIYPMQRNPF